MGWRNLVAVAVVTSGCSGSSSPSAAPTTLATTSTTSASDAALMAATEACRLGGVKRNGVDSLRTALALRGESPSAMTDDAVIRRWRQLVDQLGPEATDALMQRGDAQDASGAAAAAAKAAALDPRWEQLHRGLSNYATYVAGRGRGASSTGIDRWFEDIRLGCERARALGGS